MKITISFYYISWNKMQFANTVSKSGNLNTKRLQKKQNKKYMMCKYYKKSSMHIQAHSKLNIVVVLTHKKH